jgi:hypothetical protein
VKLVGAQIWRRARWPLVVVPLTLVLAGCGSGSGSSGSSAGSQRSPDARLKAAGASVLAQMGAYQVAAQRCASQPNAVVCLEAADRMLGGQIHSYANVLAVGHGFTTAPADLANARNQAQTLANSLEILGDAQPTQANYDQVLNTFNVGTAISRLQRAVRTANSSTRG